MISYGLSVSSPVMNCDEAAFNRIVDSPEVARLCKLIAAEPDHKRQGEMKKGLPFFCFHASFKGKRRVAKDAIPSGFAMIDVDGIEEPRKLWEEIEPRKEELKIVLTHKTPSTKGLRLVLKIPYGLTLEEAQQRIVRELNLPNVDCVVKDLARCSFAVPRSYIFFLSNDLFNDISVPQIAQIDTDKQIDKQTEKKSVKICEICGTEKTEAEICGTKKEEETSGRYNGIEYKEIIGRWLEFYLRKKPGYTTFEAPAEGDRNNTLYDLCRDMRNICDFSFQRMIDVVPNFGLEHAEVEQTVLSALKSERRTPYLLNKAIESLSSGKTDTKREQSNEEIEALNESYMEQMPALPELMRKVLEGADERFHMPIIIGLLPMLCSYADKVVFRYADGRWRRPNLMSLIVGPPMSGKSSITSQLAPVMQPMNEESKAVRDEQDEARKKNNEKKDRERGKTFEKFIKKLNMDITDAELLYNQKSANKHGVMVGEHFLPRKQFMFSEEAGVVMKAAKSDKLMSAWRIAFDNGEWGKDAHSDQAVSGMVNLSFDFTALCTMGVLQKLLDPDNIENGTASRILIGLMPGANFEEMPWFEERKKKDTKVITDAIAKLREQSEVIDSKPLIKAITEWSNTIARECAATNNLDKDMLRRRAGIIGHTAAVLFALLENKRKGGVLQVSKNAITFGLLIANYNLELQLMVFKDYAETASVKISLNGKYKMTKNKIVFDALPDEFTVADVIKLKKCSRNTAQMAIKRYEKDGFVERTSKSTYKKTTYEDIHRT